MAARVFYGNSDEMSIGTGLAGKLWTEPIAGAPETDNNQPTVPE